jgi:hypothetical protein
MDTSKTITDGGSYDVEGNSIHMVNGELVSYHQDESGKSFITTESGEVVQLHSVTPKLAANSPYTAITDGGRMTRLDPQDLADYTQGDVNLG